MCQKKKLDIRKTVVKKKSHRKPWRDISNEND